MVQVRFSEPTKLAKDNVQWHEFLSLESPHPYGVLPSGNALVNNSTTTTSRNNPKQAFVRQLRDETWLSILGFCNGYSLSRLVQSCRYFYVAGHQPELWRDLVLYQLHASQSHLSRDVMGDSWKDCFIRLQHQGKQRHSIPHKPLKISGFYSDDLYRLHSCRAFCIPPAWLEEHAPLDNPQHWTSKGLVPCIAAATMTSEKFITEFEQPNQPVVIKGAATSWKACKDWKDPQYMRQQTQGRTFRATSGAAPLPANFTLDAFQQYCSQPILEEAPLYLFDREALQPHSPLHDDFYPDLQRTCPYLDPAPTLLDTDDKVGHDLFQVLGEGKRPDHTWAILGGSHSGSVFHIDPNATHAWNAAICGRKRWIFYPPSITPPGIHPSADGDEVALPLSIGEWILTFWRDHQERKKNAPPHERPLECTAHPGDVVFVPHGWWHMVINLDQVNIAITHNYVSRSNLGNLLRFLRQKEEQISGCRDRAESIKPEQLHNVFLTALQQQFGTDAPWLVAAQQQAESHWTCKAWKDDDDNNNNNKQSRKRPLEDTGASGVKTTTSVMAKAKTSTNVEQSTTVASNAPFSFSFL
ncbi:demethylase and lysyl-hydroxylase [Seminavis robusta]|uniref:Demethylase and lysyl-hydroxylase n=1 Tax=Seminavis robusta TaxID=568900 RepID=A0A9N8DQS7_9STRA|nr:demethylase and lysyl-hydroxylase [Seminavis robusta]|eukprot:Sro220_g090640.1 demethylase and lysyl-hydroxylase (582) ;mRNA; f:10550-12419